MNKTIRHALTGFFAALAMTLCSLVMPVFADGEPPAGVITFDPEDPINAIPLEELPEAELNELLYEKVPYDTILGEYTPVEQDDRRKVTNTTIFPYSAVCKLNMYYLDPETEELKHYIGSGFLITPTTVLTCAHCVYDVENGFGEVRRIAVSPGSTNESLPFGIFDSAQGDIVKITYEPDYAANGSSSDDFALIELNEPIGDQTGYIRLTSNPLNYASLRISGYPAKVREVVDDQNQYEASGAPLMTFERRLDFRIAASGGQSGSPVLTEKNEAVGIFAYGYNGYPINGGTLLDSLRMYFIASNSDMEKPVYRAYNPNSGEHFYTTDYSELFEICQAGWKDEGLAWRSADADEGFAVYRLYDPNRGDHHYTSSAREVQHLVNVGWKDEGIAWYAPQEDEYSRIYRLYNPNALTGQHHFTTDSTEKDYLASLGWQYEGIPFNAR